MIMPLIFAQRGLIRNITMKYADEVCTHLDCFRTGCVLSVRSVVRKI